MESEAFGSLQERRMMEQKQTVVKLGSTEIDVSTLVRDISGVEDIVAKAVEEDWIEARYIQFDQRLYPFADAADLAEWDRDYILNRYPPLYLASPGNGDDSDNGLDPSVSQARLSLRKACRGCVSQLVSSREALDYAIRTVGKDKPISWGMLHDTSDCSHIGLMTGIRVESVADLDRALSYAEVQLHKLFSASHSSADASELEAMVLHAGSILLVAMNVVELVKMNLFGFTNASDHDMREMIDWPPVSVLGGLGSVERGKPVITFTGDNFLPAWFVVKQLKEKGCEDKVEICGIGAAGDDIVRYYDRCRILGPATRANKVIKTGISDVIVASGSCMSDLDNSIPSDASAVESRVIWVGRDRNIGLPDRTDDPVDSVVEGLIAGEKGVWIRDVEKAADVAFRVAQGLKRKGNYVLSEEDARDKFKMRAGRGPVPRVETTSWAFGSMWGNCPGIFHIIGCGDAKHRDDIGWITRELVSRNGIVTVGGCGAAEIGRHFNQKTGKFIYEEFTSEAQLRNIVPCGGCSACSHILDQALKWSRTGSAISHYANFTETADTVHNIIAPTLIVWGALPERMYAIIAAWVRGGLAVVVGPESGFTLNRALPGNKWDGDRWTINMTWTHEKRMTEPAPKHMLIPVETKEEAITMAANLMSRPTGIRDFRQIQLETYMDLFTMYFGEFPDDWNLFVRSDWELPLRYKSRMLTELRENHGWEVERLRARKAKHPITGEIMDMGRFSEQYGAQGLPVTRLPRLLANPDIRTKGEAEPSK